ncbi:hypothetical protein BEWA_008730 [Theileria equi strain WA]|uniref:Uncharacterized protein n=1 Tax=Theileria equi strain WA TaxID=1537102 RepID=L0B2M2_THEEQ|nr:hypothetical protein BEWA_008730 [Theileria equi strain WA]AFZ81461.1 hypothetical protein BEWA_008730 [Theileria equi strain WA]|eukprot:XP_004831127.1 hypothetical protein BEWA_008730 [Theileria equi strain WA]
MKRKVDDETVHLIGRSAAERQLDRFYNHQRSKMAKKEEEKQSLLSFNKVLPFSDSTSVKEEKQKPGTTNKKSLRDVLEDLSTKHIQQRSKFAKGVQLFTKLAKLYFKESYKTEKDVTYQNFFLVLSAINEVFVREFAGSVPKDMIDAKSALNSLVYGLIIPLIDGTPIDISMPTPTETQDKNGSSDAEPSVKTEISDVDDCQEPTCADPCNLPREYVQYLKYLKMSIGYSSSLWYENDPFKFHNICSELKAIFESILKECNDGYTPENLSQLHTTWRVPGRNELITMELKAFVRTLGVVFTFFQFPWAKSSIEPLYSLIYLKRHIFDETDQTRISEWQSHINANKSKAKKGVRVQRIGESGFQVADARDEKIASIHGSQVWTERQLI